MADRRYLKKRGESWYYQRAVPREIRGRWQAAARALAKEGLYSGDPIVVALGTQNLTEAQALRWRVNARYQEQFEKLQGRTWAKRLTPADIEAAARDTYYAHLEYLHTVEADATRLAQDAEAVQRKLDLADARKDHPELAKARAELGAPELAGPTLIVDLDFAKNKARLAAIEARRKYLEEGIGSEPPQTFGRGGIDPVTMQPVIRPKGDRGSGPAFADVAARFIAEKQRDPNEKLTEQTRGQYEAAYRLFGSYAKQPRLGEVDRKMAADFLDKVATLDPLWGRSPKTKDRSFDEIMKLYGGRQHGLTNKTVNRFAMALSMVWKYAEDRGEFADANPWIRQSRPVAKKRGRVSNDKREFRDDEIAKLLRQKAVVAPNEHNVASAMPWVVLIGAYSGMRLNEICSLDVADVKQNGGIWYFDITAAKTEAGVRCVPVHSRILKAGLLDYLKRIKRGQLFPGLKPGGPDDKLSWYLSKRFTEYRRGLDLIDIGANGKDRLDFHSLRRSAIHVLKQARTQEHEVAEVVGQEHPTITFGVYPGRHKLRELQRIVEAIRYERVGSKR